MRTYRNVQIGTQLKILKVCQLTRISLPIPLIVIFFAAPDIEHAIYHGSATNYFATVPGTGVANHCQARLAIWFCSRKKNFNLGSVKLGFIIYLVLNYWTHQASIKLKRLHNIIIFIKLTFLNSRPCQSGISLSIYDGGNIDKEQLAEVPSKT